MQVSALMDNSNGSVFCEKVRERRPSVGQRRRSRMDFGNAEKIMSSSEDQSMFDSHVEEMDVRSTVTCHVCGKPGANKHFGAICCAPCKMFFRRNVEYNLDAQPCLLGGPCGVMGNTRHACRICRFKKCLSVGMQKELLRASRMPRHRRPASPSRAHPSSSKSDPSASRRSRALLSVDQWNILSTVVHAYDNTSPALSSLDLNNTQSSFPLKLRMKITTDSFLNTLHSVFHALHPFVERLPQFSTLQLSDKTELLLRHLRTVGGFAGVLMLREANVYASPTFMNNLSLHYGVELCKENLRIVHRYEADGTIIKLFLAALIFSTCTDVVQPVSSFGYEDRARRFADPKRLMAIQNVYVETIFKYMLYRYGSHEATLRFAAITKNFLDYSRYLIHAGEYYRTQNEMIDRIRAEIIEHSRSPSLCARAR